MIVSDGTVPTCIISGSNVAHWMAQEPKPQLIHGELYWPAHKFEIGYCVRCGEKEKHA